MAACQLEMSENIKQDKPYSLKQWNCLINHINALIDCGTAMGCGQIERISEDKGLTPWAVKLVHDKLYQISPEIMGEIPPTMWTRVWLDKVVQVLREGWSGCGGDTATGEMLYDHSLTTYVVDAPECTEYWVYPELVEPFLATSCPPIDQNSLFSIEKVPLEQLVKRTAYASRNYLEWRFESRYEKQHGIDDVAPVTDFNVSPLKDTSIWFSRMQNKMVPYSEMIEDDFLYGENETPVSRFSASVSVDDLKRITPIVPVDDWTQAEWGAEQARKTFISSYTDGIDTVLMVPTYRPVEFSPFSPNVISIDSASEALIAAKLAVKNAATIEERLVAEGNLDNVLRTLISTVQGFCPLQEPRTITVPKSFVVAESVIPLAASAKYLWGLRIGHRQHLEAMITNDGRPVGYRYRDKHCPISGILKATSLQPPINFSIFIQRGVLARQWNFQGLEMRMDYGWNPNVWRCPFLHGIYQYLPGGPYNPNVLKPKWSQAPEYNHTRVSIMFLEGGQATLPICGDEWHY